MSYKFTFPEEAAGLEVAVKDADGSTVTTETLGSSPNESGVLPLEVTLDSGNYVGTVTLNTAGIVNQNPATWRIFPDRIECIGLAASLAAGGGDFRTDDVANLVALNVVGDTTSNDVHAVLVADARYGALPDWCEDAGGGNWRFGVDAGSLTIVGLGVCTIDFSETTASDSPGTINCQVTVKKDGLQVTTGNKTQDGDGADTQVVRCVASDQFSGGVMSIYVASVASDAEAVAITDGATSHDVYLKLTREAYGPVEIA